MAQYPKLPRKPKPGMSESDMNKLREMAKKVTRDKGKKPKSPIKPKDKGVSPNKSPMPKNPLPMLPPGGIGKLPKPKPAVPNQRAERTPVPLRPGNMPRRKPAGFRKSPGMGKTRRG